MERKSAFPIGKKDVEGYVEDAGSLLKSVSYQPSHRAGKKMKNKSEESAGDAGALFNMAFGKGGSAGQGVSITNVIGQIRSRLFPKTVSIPKKSNKALSTLQEAIALGLYLKDQYAKASGLEDLEQQVRSGGVDSAKKIELEAKQQTASSIAVFTTAYFMVHQLSGEHPSMDAIRNKFGGVPEVNLTTPTRALSSVLFFYGKYMEQPEFIHNDDEVLAFSLLYFEAIIEEVVLRKDALKYKEPFENNAYKLEGSEFTIDGFTVEVSHQSVSIEFNEVKFEEIVGNREAKHRALRIIAMMLSYDSKVKDNPFNKFGGFPSINMGYGKPGTGKSMLIAGTASRLKERCEWLGYKFLFWPFPDNIVSTYQGGSAERALEWFRPLQDPNTIIYAPIDDAEGSFKNRATQGVSAGVVEVIGVFLRMTEGAYAVNHGNWNIGLYTNLPDQIDPAVLSRIQYRAPIDGAVDEKDFIDQTRLWLKDYESLDSNFLSLKAPVDYEFFSNQKVLKSLGALTQQQITSPRELLTQDDIIQIYEKSLKQFPDPNTYDFFGTFYTNMQHKYAGFTSREVRNIQKIVGARIMDFDFPSEFWAKESVFFHQPFKQKVGIITELVKSNMKSLNLGEIMLEEALKYADNFARIADTAFDRQVDEMIEQMLVRAAAEGRIQKRQ